MADGAAATRSLLAMPFMSPTSGRLLGVYLAMCKEGPSTTHGGHANFTAGDATVLEHTLRLGGLMLENALLRSEKAKLEEVATMAKRGSVPSPDGRRGSVAGSPEGRRSSVAAQGEGRRGSVAAQGEGGRRGGVAGSSEGRRGSVAAQGDAEGGGRRGSVAPAGSAGGRRASTVVGSGA